MAKTRSKRLAPKVQRVKWEDVETTRGTKNRMVKLKNIFRSERRSTSPMKASASYDDAHNDMYMDANLNPEFEPSTEAPSKVSTLPTTHFTCLLIYEQSPNDYIREWLPKRADYLNAILASEAPPPDMLCVRCSVNPASWRCKDCLSWPTYCKDCCRAQHIILPFHRIQRWTGEYFAPGWMRQVGVIINLGHGGKPCPSGIGMYEQDADMDCDEREDEDSEHGQNYFNNFEDKPSTLPGRRDENGNTMLVIVDKSGIHHMPVHWCQCLGCPQRDLQLLSIGLFPCSFKRIKTVFTFQVLDDFLLNNLECKTAANHYSSKLARETNPAFPHTVPVSWLQSIFSSILTVLNVRTGPIPGATQTD
jgi:hypothetical protein